jgi:hypothetical protein
LVKALEFQSSARKVESSGNVVKNTACSAQIYPEGFFLRGLSTVILAQVASKKVPQPRFSRGWGKIVPSIAGV